MEKDLITTSFKKKRFELKTYYMDGITKLYDAMAH